MSQTQFVGTQMREDKTTGGWMDVACQPEYESAPHYGVPCGMY